MKFTDGYWQVRDGFSPLHPAQVDDVRTDPAAGTMTVYAPTAAGSARTSSTWAGWSGEKPSRTCQ